MQTALRAHPRVSFDYPIRQFPKLYVTGGHQRTPRAVHALGQDWDGYDQGLILEIEPNTGACTTRIEYLSPPDTLPVQNPPMLFQAGHVTGDKLYICSQTEVMVFQLPNFQRLWHCSLPCFNDLHHACPSPDGNILVANAGLEMVLELSWEGQVLREWNVLGEEPWRGFSRQLDYRRVSTKPHRAHPNFVFCLNAEIWVTRFHQGDAVSLSAPHRRIALSSARIHDGIVQEGMIYFTSVDGHVIVANPRTLQVEEVIDLTTMSDPGVLLGWCRGLSIRDDLLWVGFSRIRPTKFRENVSWVVRGFKRDSPTHLACYDLRKRRCLMELDMEALGLSSIYSIFPVLN